MADSYFILPAVGSEARLLVNGIPLVSSSLHKFRGFGLGTNYLEGFDDQEVATQATNSVDVILVSGTGDQFLDGVYRGDLRERDAGLTAFLEWNERLGSLALYGAIIGIFCAGLSMVARQQFGISFPIMLVSCGTLSLVEAGSLGNFRLAALWSSILISAGASLWLISYVWRRNGFFTRSLLGFALISFTSSVFAALLLTQNGTADFFLTSTFANAGQLPMIVVGGSMAAVGQIRTVLSQLAAARQDGVQKAAFIEHQTKELHKQIKSKAVIEERQRFVRDMHDGLGGHLLSLLVRLRAKRIDLDQVEEEIEGGISDLRLVVDAMDRAGNSLAEAMQIYESRAHQQLRAAGMELNWDVDLHDVSHEMDTREVLNVFRLMQEVMSNSIRHSSGTIFEVSAQTADYGRSAKIILSDNGKGFDPANVAAGNGLSNIKDRARKASAQIEISSGGTATGTTVTLLLNLGSPPRTAN
jgi:signal transduction histidine kinase